MGFSFFLFSSILFLYERASYIALFDILKSGATVVVAVSLQQDIHQSVGETRKPAPLC
jgi:hypothetical protein